MASTSITTSGIVTDRIDLNGKTIDGVADNLSLEGGNPQDIAYADDVKLLVDTAIASVGGGETPVTSSGGLILTNHISEGLTSRINIPGLEPVQQIALTNTLGHFEKGPYDPMAGYISASHVPVNDTTLSQMVSPIGAIASRMAFFEFPDAGTYGAPAVEGAVIDYVFHRMRAVNSVTFRLGHATAPAWITAIDVVINGVTHTADVSAVGTGQTDEFVYTIPAGPITTNRIRLQISAITGSNGDRYAIGFDVGFSDTSGEEVSLLDGTKLNIVNSDGEQETYQIQSPLPVDLTGTTDGHWYGVSVDVGTAQTMCHATTPYIGPNAHLPYTAPLRNALMRTAFFEDMVFTGTYDYLPGNLLDLFGDNEHVEPVSGTLDYLHTFPEAVPLKVVSVKAAMPEVTLRPLVVLEDYFTTAEMTVTYSDDSTEVIDLQVAQSGIVGTSPFEMGSGSKLVAKGQSVIALKGTISSALSVKSIAVNVVGITGTGTTARFYFGLDYQFGGAWYNTYTKRWSDDVDRVMMGWVRRDPTTGYTVFRPAAVGNRMQCIPGSEEANAFLTTSDILNPFFHDRIEVDGNASVISASVNPESIRMITSNEGRPVVTLYPQSVF